MTTDSERTTFLAPTPFERSVRWQRRHGPSLAAALSLLWMAVGPAVPALAWPIAVILSVAAVALAARRFTDRSTDEAESLALHLVAAAAVVAVVRAEALLAPAWPLVVVPVALLGAVPARRWLFLGALLSVVTVIAAGFAWNWKAGVPWGPLCALASAALAALLVRFVVHERIRERREVEAEAVRQRLGRARQEALDWRLLVRADDASAPVEVELPLVASTEALAAAAHDVVAKARDALDARALAFFRLADGGTRFVLVAGADDTGLLIDGPLSTRTGLLATVLETGAVLRETGKPAGVNWYRRRVSVGAVCALPVRVGDDGALIGVLVADRLDAEAFDDRAVALLSLTASSLAQLLEGERWMLVHAARLAERTRWTNAVKALNGARSIHGWAEATSALLPAAGGDGVAFVTLFEEDPEHPIQRVLVATGDGAEAITGRAFSAADGLVADALRAGTPTPNREGVTLWKGDVSPPDAVRSVWPLEAGGRTVGALVLVTAGAWDAAGLDDWTAVAGLIAGAMGRVLVHDEWRALQGLDADTLLPSAAAFEKAMADRSDDVGVVYVLCEDTSSEARVEAAAFVRAAMAGAQAGHDEEGQFVLVVSGGLAAAGERADRLRDRFAVAGRGHGVAIGLSSTATHGRLFGELLRAARQAALNVRDSSRVVAAAELRTVVGR